MGAQSVNISTVLKCYSPGDGGTWAQEFEYLRVHHAERIAELTASLAAEPQREPVVLGNDGRVWDGHHRLCALSGLQRDDVLVDFVDGGA